MNDPYLIHYTTSFLSLRPWVKGCKHRYVHLWFKYKYMSCWADMPLWENEKLNKKDKIKKILVLPAASFAQTVLRPVKNFILK